jgi:SAM-dependent methyltransferase
VKAGLVDYLACPACQAELDLTVSKRDGEEIVDGTLRCRGCGRSYAIVRAIPRLLAERLAADKQKTADAFSWQWQHFTEMHDRYEAQFLDWIDPIEPAFFRNKLVMDAGCGIGRHAYFAARYGARDVIAIDVSAAVETAYRNIGHLPNAHVIQADIYSPPFRRAPGQGPFDFIYSIGVLHHLPDPEAGFRSLVGCLRPGGTIFGWVYGYENNALIHRLIDPFRRRITSRLPPPLLRPIAFPMAAILHGVVKGVYRPLRRTAIVRPLPAHAYLISLADFNFRQNYNIVFDHLVAPTAFYLKREEFEAWFQRAGLEAVELSWRNQNSWRGRGRLPGMAEPRPVPEASSSSPSPVRGR